jgi:hypothetical protein
MCNRLDLNDRCTMTAMIGYQLYTQFAIFSTFQYDVHVMKFVEK